MIVKKLYHIPTKIDITTVVPIVAENLGEALELQRNRIINTVFGQFRDNTVMNEDFPFNTTIKPIIKATITDYIPKEFSQCQIILLKHGYTMENVKKMSEDTCVDICRKSNWSEDPFYFDETRVESNLKNDSDGDNE